MEVFRWEQAAERWLVEKQDKADIRGDKAKLEWLAAHLNGKAPEEIDRETVRRSVGLPTELSGKRAILH